MKKHSFLFAYSLSILSIPISLTLSYFCFRILRTISIAYPEYNIIVLPLDKTFSPFVICLNTISLVRAIQESVK